MVTGIIKQLPILTFTKQCTRLFKWGEERSTPGKNTEFSKCVSLALLAIPLVDFYFSFLTID